MKFKDYIKEDITVEMPDGTNVTKKTKKKNIGAVVIAYGQSYGRKEKPMWQIVSLHNNEMQARKNADRLSEPHWVEDKDDKKSNSPWWEKPQVKKV
jgi:threonine dehydratase